MHKIWLNNESNLEADGLQQQKTTHGASPVSYEKETEATVHHNQRVVDGTWSDESKFLLWKLNGRVNIWHKHGSMDTQNSLKNISWIWEVIILMLPHGSSLSRRWIVGTALHDNKVTPKGVFNQVFTCYIHSKILHV